MVSTVDSSALALLVLKLELFDVDAVNTNGVERMTLWVNPDLSQPENLATAVNGTNYVTDRDFVQIDRVRIGGGGYSATAGGDPTEHYLDEIVISSVSPFAPKLSPGTPGRALRSARQPFITASSHRILTRLAPPSASIATLLIALVTPLPTTAQNRAVVEAWLQQFRISRIQIGPSASAERALSPAPESGELRRMKS